MEFGKRCELHTLIECVLNIELHATQLFDYDISKNRGKRMNREKMIKDLESLCEEQEYCFSDCIESICPLYKYEWDCDFHCLPDSELTKAYNDIFGIQITIPFDGCNQWRGNYKHIKS